MGRFLDIPLRFSIPPPLTHLPLFLHSFLVLLWLCWSRYVTAVSVICIEGVEQDATRSNGGGAGEGPAVTEEYGCGGQGLKHWDKVTAVSSTSYWQERIN